MRKDGSITYYTILARWVNSNDKKWFLHNDVITCIHWNPKTKKYFDPYHEKESYLGKDYKSNRDDPSCSGYLWQNYGDNGVTNLPAVERWLKVLLPYYQWRLDIELKGERSSSSEQKEYKRKMECEFKIVKITKTQKTEFV